MTQRSRLAIAALSVLATIALASAAADARPGQNKGQSLQRSAAAIEISDVTLEPPTVIIEGQQNLPPGLQRQAASGQGLPSGLQRQVDSGRGLPPGLQRAR